MQCFVFSRLLLVRPRCSTFKKVLEVWEGANGNSMGISCSQFTCSQFMILESSPTLPSNLMIGEDRC
jgi:hypothetical protein